MSGTWPRLVWVHMIQPRCTWFCLSKVLVVPGAIIAADPILISETIVCAQVEEHHSKWEDFPKDEKAEAQLGKRAQRSASRDGRRSASPVGRRRIRRLGRGFRRRWATRRSPCATKQIGRFSMSIFTWKFLIRKKPKQKLKRKRKIQISKYQIQLNS